jgi:hypothetical protein
MDHNTLPQPKFELPNPQKPAIEQLAPLEADQNITQATEARNTETPAAPAPISPAQAAQSVAAADPLGLQQMIPPLTTSTAALGVAATNDLAADDGDLIEKAWVQKAKAIVEQTKNDPFRQNAEINKVKKDYIQKRYNVDVKLSDE